MALPPIPATVLPTRATLLTARLGTLREWNLIATCPCLAFPRHLSVERLAVQFGEQPRLESILARLRCSRCGRSPMKVEAKRGDPFAVRVSAVVLLETKGAVGRNRG